MNQQTLLAPNAQTVHSSNKWGEGISADHSLGKAARRIVEARLEAVWHWLPLAAEKSEEDIEHVHQLRISARRAVEALRVFADLIPAELRAEFGTQLRQVRLAADGARNWDVLSDRFRHGTDACAAGVTAKVMAQIKNRRREAQQPLLDIYRDLTTARCGERIQALARVLRSQRKGKARRTFGKQTGRRLRPVLEEFLKAAAADLSSDAALHDLRIRTKKLRYTMEIVAVAFAPGFRKKLYPRISAYQDLMGTVNDHATTRTLFQDWLQRSQDLEERAFCEGVLLAEARAHEDVRQEFLALWTPETVARLRRQFGAYCALP